MSRKHQSIYEEIGHYVWNMYRKSAMYGVKKAKADGRLPQPHTQSCVDCGKQAAVYDHRDYSKPVDVVPVCDGCNMRRGAGTLDLERIRLDLGPYWEGGDPRAYALHMGERCEDDDEPIDLDETHFSPS